MSGHWGRIGRATGRSPAPAPRRSSGAPPVLSLQRAVGNRATGRLLQRRPKWVGLSLGTNNSKQEVKIKREIGTRGGYDNRLQAIAAARLAGADPAAVALGDDKKWHAFELTADFNGATYAGGPKAGLSQVFGLPTAKAVSAQEAKIADLKKHKGDVDAQVNEAQRQLYALKLGVGDSELLFNLWSKDRKAVWSKDRKAGVINVTAALAGDINAALGYHGAAGGAKDSFEAGVATAIELNPKAFESDMQGSVLFHEAVHLDDYELTQKLIRDYGKFVPVQEGRVAFDTWVRKQPNLTAGQKQLASDIVFGAFGTTEARAYVKTFLVAFDAGARQRAAASLLAYAKGMNDKRVPSPTQDERNPVVQELKAEVRAFRGKLGATARPDFDAAISTAVAANSSAWIRILEVRQPGQKRAVRK